MDFQQLLNLIKGNLGGQGMKRVEDGSMMHAGFGAPPVQTPMSADNVITNGLVKTGALPPERAEIYPQGNEAPLPTDMQPPAPPPFDFQTLLRGLLGQ